MMKKRIAFLAAAVLLICAFFTACTPEEDPGGNPLPPVDDSTIHLYMIAGQSNAVGNSPIDYAVESDMGQVYENILYAGETNRNITSLIPSSSYGLAAQNSGTPAASFNSGFVSVKAGLGRSAANIGPEYGMADILDDRYAGERKALFFKTAADGTSVRNLYTENANAVKYGNWYPRSLSQELSAGQKNAATGKLYNRLIENFETAYNKLTEAGHKVKVAGMVWMQGETDRMTDESVAAYPDILGTFVADLREDIGEITGKDCSRMPFVAGEISRTHGIIQGSTQAQFDTHVARNDVFNTMLNAIEQNKTIPHFAVAKAQELPQNKMEGNQSVQLNPVDQWHWTADHMVTLGQRFAEKLTEIAA